MMKLKMQSTYLATNDPQSYTILEVFENQAELSQMF